MHVLILILHGQAESIRVRLCQKIVHTVHNYSNINDQEVETQVFA